LTDLTSIYQIMPGERIAYAPTGQLTSQNTTPPATTHADYDVVAATHGTGYITWNNQPRPLQPGGHVAIPPDATYTITATTDLHYIVIGISTDPEPDTTHP
jgi:mannose-6-phosphate isomerase-like protein (cupin superfamily)